MQARVENIHILTLGVGERVNSRELSAIASYPQTGNTLAVSGFTSLPDVTEDLLTALCDSQFKFFVRF